MLTRLIRHCSTIRTYYTKTLINKEKGAKRETAITNDHYLVPRQPIKSKIDLSKLPPKTRIDAETIALLERLSLVDCANKEAIETLEDAIAFADQIHQVDTNNVDPLITVLEDRSIINFS